MYKLSYVFHLLPLGLRVHNTKSVEIFTIQWPKNLKICTINWKNKQKEKLIKMFFI